METLIVLGALALAALPFSARLRRDSRPARLAIIAFSVAVAVRYLAWRVTSTLPPLAFTAERIFAQLFLTLEVIVFVDVFVELFMLRSSIDRSADVDRQLDWYGESVPRVDIFIPTYDESWEVLEKTVAGARHQDYPGCQVWILDDGRRGWLRQRAEALGVGYITRAPNGQYKAGNLNNAIAVLRKQGIVLEHIAVLDADFIARPAFVRRAIALMKTADVGIVQTSQAFYNQDPFQRVYGGVRSWPDEQRAWFDVQQPCLDSVGGAMCCGTSFLVRAAALDAIGGFPCESIIEDNPTSDKMAEKGWRTIFLREPLSVGLAPESLGELLKQRARWLHGQIQSLRWRSAPSGIGGRISYWCRLWRRFNFALERLAWVAFGILFWLTGSWILHVEDPIEVLSYFAPLWLARLFQGWAYGGRQTVFVSDAHWMLFAPLYVTENIRAALGRPARFHVTDKGVRSENRVVEWRAVRVQLVLGLMLCASVVYASVAASAAARGSGMLPLHAAMTAYSLLVIGAAVGPAIQPPRRRRADRYASTEEVSAVVGGTRMVWRCKDISIGGVLVYANGWSAGPRAVEIHVAEVGPVYARLVRRGPGDLAAFAFESPEARPALIRKLYCGDGYVPMPERWSLPVAAASCVKHLVTLLIHLIPTGRARAPRKVPSVTDVSVRSIFRRETSREPES